MEGIKKFIKDKDVIIIFIFFAIYSLQLILKLYIHNDYIPDWDESHHLRMGLLYFNSLVNHDIFAFQELFTRSYQLYPPFYHFAISASYALFGVKSVVGVYTNIPFILLLMFSIYGLGSQMGNKNVGLLAAVLTPVLPIFMSLQQRVLIDYVSISMFVTSYYLLFKTNNFLNRKYSILFGISIFFGFLIKWPFVIPAIPFAFYAFNALRIQNNKRWLVVSNILIILNIILPSLIWYCYNYRYMINILNFFWSPTGIPQIVWSGPKGWSVENLALYLYTFPAGKSGVGLITLIYFYYSIFATKRTLIINYFLLTMLITYAVLTYLNDKSGFYIAYIYPLAMLIVTNSLLEIRSKARKHLFLTVFILAIYINFGLVLYNYTNYKQISINIFGTNLMLFPNIDSKFIYGEWPTRNIVKNYLTWDNCEGGILVFPDNRFINFPNVRYFLSKFAPEIPTDYAYRYYNPTTDSDFDLSILNNYKCIISKTDNPGQFANQIVLSKINSYLDKSSEFLTYKFDAPDKSQIVLYVRK